MTSPSSRSDPMQVPSSTSPSPPLKASSSHYSPSPPATTAPKPATTKSATAGSSRFLFKKTSISPSSLSSPSPSLPRQGIRDGVFSAFRAHNRHKATVVHEATSGHRSIPLHPHYSDPWHQWEGLVFILVIFHVLVIVFYAWILLKDRRKGENSSSSSSGEGFSKRAKKIDWRTPKDILNAYEKKRIGKA